MLSRAQDESPDTEDIKGGTDVIHATATRKPEETEIRAVGSHLSLQLYNIFPLPGALPLGSPFSGKTIKQRIQFSCLHGQKKEH